LAWPTRGALSDIRRGNLELAYRKPLTRLPAPYLKRLIFERDRVEQPDCYPFNLPFLEDGSFEIEFTTPITIIVGENGAGKSTLLEAIGGIAGYDEAGGGKGYMPEDHSGAVAVSGKGLGQAFRAHWLPKITAGWFFRAESFYTVARYLDRAALDANAGPPDYLSASHGEGFLEFFEQRLLRQGFFIFDEPESALSPRRQIDLLKLLSRAADGAMTQVVMATHSPLLMACPGARVLKLDRRGLAQIDFRETEHFRMLQQFVSDPASFLTEQLSSKSP